MAKAIRDLKYWIEEVAPALLILPTKTSNSPSLETIPEEDDSDDFDQDL
ncbi:hypothetical protein CsSME_00038337 [Camellia sinensis var. sinensis]